jgi:cell division protein FtsA
MIGESEPREVPRVLLPEIIAPRMEELFLLLRQHIEKAEADGVFIAQCVLSGGGSQLAGVAEVAQHVLEMPVRIGYPREVSDPRGIVNGPAYATAVGLLVFAAQRVGVRSPAREPRPLVPATLELLTAWLRRILRRF